MKNKLSLMLTCFLFFVFFPLLAFPQIFQTYSQDLLEKDMFLFGQDDVVIRGVFNDYDAWVTIPDYVKVEDAVLVLKLSHAKELFSNLSSLTIYVNGVPAKSIFLVPENSDNYTVTVNLDQKNFIVGTNQIRFTFFMRSVDVPCADMDNPINWSILKKDSLVHFKYRIADNPAVSLWDKVFSKSGQLFQQETALVLGENPDEATISAASILANYLGSVSGIAQNIRVISERELTAEDLAKFNLILLGEANNFPLLAQLRKIPALGGLKEIDNLKENEGLVFLARSAWDKEKFIFGITGLKPQDVKKCAFYISNSDTSEFYHNIEVLKLKSIDNNKPRFHKRPPVEGRFSALGYPDITVSGVFYRKTSFSFIRPCNWKLRNAALEFLIQYSPFLIPDISGVTIEINGTPVVARKFTGNPDRPLLVRAVIPEEASDRKYYFVSANFFLDIGQKDCNHQLKDRAWAVVKNNSSLFLPHGFKNNKDFSDFPAMLMHGNNLSRTTIFIPDKPNSDVLSLAMTLFSNIGASLPYEPVIPEIKKANSKKSEIKKENIIILGNPAEFSWYDEINQYLPIAFNKGKDAFQAIEDLPNVKFEGNFALMQMGISPRSRTRTISVFTAGAEGYVILRKILTNPGIYDNIRGDVVFASSENSVSSSSIKVKEKKQLPQVWMISIWFASVLIFTIAVATVYWFILRKKQ